MPEPGPRPLDFFLVGDQQVQGLGLRGFVDWALYGDSRRTLVRSLGAGICEQS